MIRLKAAEIKTHCGNYKAKIRLRVWTKVQKKSKAEATFEF